MRRVSHIGWIAVAASAACALAATPSTAEAGGFRLRLGIGSAAAATPVPVPPRAAQRIAAAAIPIPVAAPRSAPEAPPPVAGLTPVTLANRTGQATPSQPPVRVAGPWCPPDRIVGAGAGFCAIN